MKFYCEDRDCENQCHECEIRSIRDEIINKPSHYHKNEIDVHGYLQKHFPKEGTYTVAEGFHIGNVLKYVSRYKQKNGLEDLKKAEANLKILIELEEKKEKASGS